MKHLIWLSHFSVKYSFGYSTLVASVPTSLGAEGTDQKESASGNTSLLAKIETGKVLAPSYNIHSVNMPIY